MEMGGKAMRLNEKQIMRQIMSAHGVTLKDAAAKVGVSAQALANQFNRADSTMTMTSLYSLCGALGCKLIVRDGSGTEYEVNASETVTAIEKQAEPEQTLDDLIAEPIEPTADENEDAAKARRFANLERYTRVPEGSNNDISDDDLRQLFDAMRFNKA